MSGPAAKTGDTGCGTDQIADGAPYSGGDIRRVCKGPFRMSDLPVGQRQPIPPLRIGWSPFERGRLRSVTSRPGGSAVPDMCGSLSGKFAQGERVFANGFSMLRRNNQRNKLPQSRDRNRRGPETWEGHLSPEAPLFSTRRGTRPLGEGAAAPPPNRSRRDR